jgi:mRNA interferase MazF
LRKPECSPTELEEQSTERASQRARLLTVVIIQDDSFDATSSVTICAFTADETDAPLFRLAVEPSERNGLRAACRLMVDKIAIVPKTKVGARVGRLDHEDILRLNQAVLVFLGLAVSPRTQQGA